MRIESDIKLDFDSVLIRPKRSTLSSRKEVDLNKVYHFRHTDVIFSGVPIIAANMDHTGTFAMADALEQHAMSVAVHKHYSVNDLAYFFQGTDGFHFYSMGTAPADLEKYKEVCKYTKPFVVCIDVANGYSESFVEFVKKFRDENPTTVIMAGNVVTGEMVEELILAGADIVKVGIGPGCQVADTRILLSNGTYKNIVDVQPGDRIITMTGEPATVNKSFTTGYRKVRDVRNAHFYKPLTQTSDHKCFVGDLSTVDKSTVRARGYKPLLETPSKDGKEKLKWKETRDLANTVALIPNKIQWELPQNFSIDISEYFLREEHKVNYNMTIESNYALGYMFGFFLGDGCARKYKGTNKKGHSSFSGGVEWYINSKDQDRVVELSRAIATVVGKSPTVLKANNESVTQVLLYSKQWGELFLSFGKFENKHLPEKYMCLNKDYLEGLYNGLVDSDGHVTKENQVNFFNTSQQLMELFGWLNYELFGSFPNMLNNGKQSSYLVEHPQHDGYRSFLASTHGKRQLENYQIVKILDISDEHEVEVPVYDLEIDHPTHSFIANNMIVHNSVCTTRKMTGVGYPQLSAVIECADAAHGLGGHVCSDGGCTTPGDIAKAFGAGADFVMLGGMLAGHEECDGERIYDDMFYHHSLAYKIYPSKEVAEQAEETKFFSETDNKFYCQDPSTGAWYEAAQPELYPTHIKFYGMSSKSAMEKHSGGVAEYRASEGKEVLVPYRGPVVTTVKEILGGVRSACTYTGSKNLKELPKRTTFVMVNQTHNRVFGD